MDYEGQLPNNVVLILLLIVYCSHGLDGFTSDNGGW